MSVELVPPIKNPIPGKGPRAGDGTWLEPDDTYYYVLNRKNMRYHCDHERHLLSRNLYSKRELDLFFEEIYMYDKKKPHKVRGICMVATGFFFVILFLLFLILGWRQGWKDSVPRADWTAWRWVFYILMVLFLLLAIALLCLGFFSLVSRKANKTVRRKALTEIINNENYRIAPRGMNWAFYDEHLALRTNYWTPMLKTKRAVSVASTKKVVEEVVTTTPRRPKVRTVIEERPLRGSVVKEEVLVGSSRSVKSKGGRYRNSGL
jgi:hypothetical protein